jgi:hypothetical protein
MSGKPKLHVPEARGLCRECLEDPKQMAILEHICVCYCYHHLCGGYMVIANGEPSGVWKLETPISREDFARKMGDAIKGTEKVLEKLRRKAEEEGEDGGITWN